MNGSNSTNSTPQGQARECPDLRELCGRRFRLKHETGRKAHHDDDPWLLLADCTNGTIGPWGPGLLVATTNNRGPLIGKLAKLPAARIAQDGDDGVNVVFPADQFKAACALMKPRRRRQLTAGSLASLDRQEASEQRLNELEQRALTGSI